MNDNTMYRARLGEMLAEVTDELKSVGIHSPENKEDWIAVPKDLDAQEPDENLSADSVEEWDERQGIVSALEPRYNAIVSALARIDAGTFGKCEVCGKEIEAERLTVNPAAQTCIEHRESVV